MRGRYTEYVRPLGPRIVGCPLRRRHRHQFELRHGTRTLPVSRAGTVRTRIATADEDDVLAARRDELLIGDRVAFASPVLEREVLHRKVNPVEFAPRHWQVSRLTGSGGEQHGVEVGAEPRDGHITA